MVSEYLAEIRRLAEAAQRDWDPEHRAAQEAHLLAELRTRGVPVPARPVTPPAAEQPAPPPVEPAELIAPAGDGPYASVVLRLELHLGAYPAPDEVVACFRAFRRHFPVDATLSWAIPDRYSVFPKTVANPDDEVWRDELRVGSDGLFGLRVTIEPDTPQWSTPYLMNVAHPGR